MKARDHHESPGRAVTVLFLAGDVMTGRGIDQVLAHPVDPRLHEPYVRTAAEYVSLADFAHGPIPAPVPPTYVWGDALDEWRRVAPDVRIVNLETAVTTSDDFAPRKQIHYRMHPDNVDVLTAAGIDACSLANNHVLDWGPAGLAETLLAVAGAGIATAGLGHDLDGARAPAILDAGDGRRVLLFACGMASSGIAPEGAATPDRPGVHLVRSDADVAELVALIREARGPGDLVVLSVHWGGNWGYDVPRDQVEFAHRLVDEAGVDVVHGHSSHHVKGIEVHRGRLVLYGCGDFVNDYEGIGGYEAWRGDLSLMYFVSLDGTGRLVSLEMTPTTMRRFQVRRVTDPEDVAWLRDVLSREGERFGTAAELSGDGRLVLVWGEAHPAGVHEGRHESAGDG